MGRYINYSINIPTGNTTYNVFWAADKLSEQQDVEAGVNVIVNNKPAATVKCSGKNIVNNMEGVELKKSE